MLTNLPAGVTKGTVTRTGANAVTIALSGNRTTDYDSNITNLQVAIDKSQINNATANVSANTGVTFTAVVEDFALAIVGGQPTQFQINHSNYSPTFAAANANLLKGADGTSNGAVSIAGSDFTYEVILDVTTTPELGDQINVADNGSGVITITVTDANANLSLDGTHTITVRDTVQTKIHSLTFVVSGTAVSNVTIL